MNYPEMDVQKRTHRFRGRLAQFMHSAAKSQAWEAHWADSNLQDQYRWAARGALGVYRDSFLRQLPKGGLIVEAGCGTGRYVRALHALGYRVIGVDWAVDTLRRAAVYWKDAPLAGADVRKFPLGDACAAAVISLGVIEHFLDPWKTLEDGLRILRPGGILYLVVPYASPLRRIQYRRGKYPLKNDEHDFYQYLLASQEIQMELVKLGFEIVEHFPTSGYSGLIDEWPQLDKLVRGLPNSHSWINLLNRSRLLACLAGHVVHYVARKSSP